MQLREDRSSQFMLSLLLFRTTIRAHIVLRAELVRFHEAHYNWSFAICGLLSFRMPH